MAGKMDMVDEGALEKVADNYCNCSFQAIKKQYKSPDDALEKSTDELLQSASDCEPTPEDISGLLK